MKIIKLIFIFPLLTILISSCFNDEGFQFLEESQQIEDTETSISITSWTPDDDLIVITNSSSVNLGVATTSITNVNYTFKLDGTALNSSTTPFYRLYGTAISSGTHSFEIVAANTISQDSHTFAVKKNTPPAISNTTPASTGNNAICNGGNITFTVNASDVDSDSISYIWLVNGVSGSIYLATSNVANGSQSVFSPACSLSGSTNITVEVSDGYETVTYTWGVDVQNPTMAQIVDYSPTIDPVVILSTGSQTFSISAVGKDPTTYSWELDGVVIAGAENTIYQLNAASLSVGEHVLKAVVSDVDTTDEHSFNVLRNAPPVISLPVPSTLTNTMSYQAVMNLGVTVNDENAGQTMTYTWRLDDNTHSSLTNTNNTAVFAPNSGLIGDHTIKVVVSDGYETAEQSWQVNVNYFSSACNNLSAGQICTIAGNPSLGTELDPTDDQTLVKIRPTYILDDGNENWFISDETNHVIWFYNRSGSDVTVANLTVAAGTIRVILGNGTNGRNTDGLSNINYKLYSPQMMAWDSANGDLYVADYNNHRVVKLNSSGVATRIFGTQTTTNNTASNTDGAAGTSHVCGQAAGLVLDGTNLYVACHYSHSIKRIDISDPANIKGYVYVGKLNGSGATTAANVNGSIGPTGDAYVYNPWGLALDSDSNLYVTQRSSCRVRVIASSGSPLSFFGGAVTVAANQINDLIGTGSCTTATGALASLAIYNPRGVTIYESGGNIKGFFVNNTDHHRVLFVNNTGSTITYGNVPVDSYEGQTVLGTGSATYNGDGDYGGVTALYAPRSAVLSQDKNSLYVTSYNGRVRELNLSLAAGTVSTPLGQNMFRYGFISDSDSPPGSVFLYYPTYMTVDTNDNILYYSDSYNRRIRKVNLSTGLVGTAIGKGYGAGNVENQDPLNVYMRTPQGLTMYNNHLIYADQMGGEGDNRDCLVRAWNKTASSSNIFNTSIVSNTVSTIAGNLALLGCGLWDPSYDGGAAKSARLRHMQDITTDGSNLYIANYDTHCILKVDINGIITEHVGQCNTAGDVEGLLNQDPVAELLRYPMSLVVDPLHTNPANLFILDRYDQNPSKIKYANFSSSSVTIAGTEVPAGYIKAIKVTAEAYCSGLAIYENQICYSCGRSDLGDYGTHNVTCFDRSDPFGNTTIRIGASDTSDTKAGTPLGYEQEGISAASAKLYAPQGLAFDQSGNLYISERSTHIIRKVKRWW